MANDDDSDIDSVDGGFRLLLGGLSISQVSPTAWDDEEEEDPALAAINKESNNSTDVQENRQEANKSATLYRMENLEEERTYGCYDRAFHCTQTGQLIRPPVRIVDMVSLLEALSRLLC